MEAEKEDQINLPWLYRLILKLPKISLESTSGTLQGVYWAIVIPLFVVCESFLSLFLVLAFPFPINLVMVGIIPMVVFVIFVKVQLERFMNWWNFTLNAKPKEWDIEKATKEYTELLQRQKSKTRILGALTYKKNGKED